MFSGISRGESPVEGQPGRFGCHLGRHRQLNDSRSLRTVVLDEWAGPLGKNLQFSPDVVVTVVAALAPISADIRLDPRSDNRLTALQGHHGMNVDDSPNGLRLANMARQPVEYDFRLPVTAAVFEEAHQNPFGEWKAIVFEEGSGQKHGPEIGQILLGETGLITHVGDDPPEIGSEIEVTKSSLAQTGLFDAIAQWRLSRSGGAKKQDSLVVLHGLDMVNWPCLAGVEVPVEVVVFRGFPRVWEGT